MFSTMKKFLVLASIVALLAPVGGCVGGLVSQSESTKIETVLTQLGNTLTTDLTNAGKTFAATTPPNLHGVQCVGTLPDPTKPGDLGTGALSVVAAIQRVLAVNAGQQVGTFTAAAVASAFQPGSASFNWAVTQIETGCIALIHDENQAINSTVGIFTALPSVLALAAAPAGM